jgi:isoamylase
VQQDPVLSQVKLIAEPWDLGTEGYRLGGFPAGFSEWNDRFRDAARRFWRGDAGTLPDLASRLTGSSDFFGANNRGTAASINYVCSHDGMTLADLVSYSHKHNEANLEAGRDGPNDASCNWGVEGPSRDRRVLRARGRAQRNLAVTLSLALGVPMWLAGDEFGRSQGGNNNAYCQDNEISWIDWQRTADHAEWLDFVRRCFAVRRANAVYRRRRHLDGLPSDCAVWLRCDGEAMTAADWEQPELRCVSLQLDASLAEPVDEDGVAQAARTVFLMLNGDSRTHVFALPRLAPGSGWIEVLNTGCAHHVREVKAHHLKLAAHSMVVLEAEASP